MSSEINQILCISSIGDQLYKTVGVFIIVISTIGNLCNCFVFLGVPALSKHPNALFIVGSSIGSLLFINLGLWPSIIQALWGINLSNQWLFWCQTSTWITYSSGCFSFMCHCFAAFGQFLITLPRVKWQRLITRLKAKLMLLLTATFWLCIFLPIPIYNIHVPTSATTRVCTSSRSIITTYSSYCVVIGYYFLPVVLTLVLFGLTWYNLKQLLRRRRSLEGAVTRMMLIQMSLILISGIPTGAHICYLIASQNPNKARLRLAYEYLVFFVLTLCTCLTNGISFWVYFFVSKPFRKHLKEFISKYQLFKNRLRPFDISMARITTN